MFLRGEVRGRLLTAAAVVDVDVVRTRKVDVRGNEHRWDPRDRVGEEIVFREPQAGHRDDETLDTPLEHEPEVGALVVLRPFLDAADDQEVPALARLGQIGRASCRERVYGTAVGGAWR